VDGLTKFLVGMAFGFVLRGLVDNVRELTTPTLVPQR
jgi:hypothetical protein